MSTERPSSKAAARTATRTALLEAATRLLVEAPGADPLAALRPVEIARRADPPRSTGAFYNIWPTQAEFRRDLLHHVLSPDRYTVTERTTSLLSDLLGDPARSVEETFRIAATLCFDTMAGDWALRMKQSLWAASSDQPEVRDLLAALYADVSEKMIPFYRTMLDRAGRRMRAPHTVEELAVVLAALLEGLQLRADVQPEAMPTVSHPVGVMDGDERPWSLFGSSAYLMFLAMSEPL